MCRPTLRGSTLGADCVALALVTLLTFAAGTRAQDPASARQAWNTGEYEDAVRLYAELASLGDVPAVVHQERARLLAELGRLDEAERTLRDPGTGVAPVAVAATLGEVLLLQGRRAEAEAELKRALDTGTADRNVALLQLGKLYWDRGERDRALELFDSFIDLYNGTDRLGAADLMAVGEAVRYLSARDPALVQDALRAYDEAAQVAPRDPRPTLLAGDLFLAKYNAPEAHASFDRVLGRNPRHPDALLGKARVQDFDGKQAEAMVGVRAALETNPQHVGARTFLARLHLKLEEFDSALAEVERTLEANPSSLEALAMLAAVHFLGENDAAYRAARDRALALNPSYPDLFNTVAELAVDNRRYLDAVDLAAQAVALDSTSWWGWGILGINQLRVGRIEEGTANVTRAFDGDPHNVWLFNTLELTDTFDRFRTVRTPHFELFLHGQESELLAPYVSAIAEEAFAALTQRYRTEPPTPVRVEIFPSHGDFSVRTLGLTGLGALGVSFGGVMVMDSPSARTPGEFNWASTLWHELAHTFHLAITRHRVPRWFSEGLAVHEQRTARSRWGHKPSVGFLQAYQTGRLHPVSELNRGFVRPDYPEQVVFSYLQASLVFQMIEERHGIEAILHMLTGYAEGHDTGELFDSVLGMSAEALDAEFDAYLRSRFADELAAVAQVAEPLPPGAPLEVLQQRVRSHPGDYLGRLSFGRALFEAGRSDEAEEQLREALRLFPGYGGPGSPYLYLARIHRDRGELDRAAAALHALGERSETAYAERLEEAATRRLLRDLDGEAAALAKSLEVYPYDPEVHEDLAALYEEIGDNRGVVRERTAVLALDPADRAQALYRLAEAHLQDGNREAARERVLQALEIAPSYDDALELLLRIRGNGS